MSLIPDGGVKAVLHSCSYVRNVCNSRREFMFKYPAKLANVDTLLIETVDVSYI